MINRRDFILAALGMISIPYPLLAGMQSRSALSWDEFLTGMQALVQQHKNHSMSLADVSEHGLKIMQQLDVDSDSFIQAIAHSYESGNRFWLWQRLVKERGLNGGVLHVERQQAIPLHDHPQATGMLRMLSGEAEVWQFDRVSTQAATDGSRLATLRLRSHKLLKPGDSAVLTPAKGNIHAIKAKSPQCSMLDFFIPPYSKSERSWYTPVSGGLNQQQLVCTQTSEHEFS